MAAWAGRLAGLPGVSVVSRRHGCLAGICKTTVVLAVEALKLREAEPSTRSRHGQTAEPGRGLQAWASTLVLSAQTHVLSTVGSAPSLHPHSGHKCAICSRGCCFPSFLISVFYVCSRGCCFPSFLISVFHVLTALHRSSSPDLAQRNIALCFDLV